MCYNRNPCGMFDLGLEVDAVTARALYKIATDTGQYCYPADYQRLLN